MNIFAVYFFSVLDHSAADFFFLSFRITWSKSTTLFTVGGIWTSITDAGIRKRTAASIRPWLRLNATDETVAASPSTAATTHPDAGNPSSNSGWITSTTSRPIINAHPREDEWRADFYFLLWLCCDTHLRMDRQSRASMSTDPTIFPCQVYVWRLKKSGFQIFPNQGFPLIVHHWYLPVHGGGKIIYSSQIDTFSVISLLPVGRFWKFLDVT